MKTKYAYLFRYQIIPTTQHIQSDFIKGIHTIDDLKKMKNTFFIQALDSWTQAEHYGNTVIKKTIHKKENYRVLKIGTQKTVGISNEDLTDAAVDSWPYTYVVINNDSDKQVLIIGKEFKAFSDPSVVAKIIANEVNKELEDKSLRVEIEGLFEKSDFWTIIKKNKGTVTNVVFDLVSPNMANISHALEIDLHQLNTDTNTARTQLALNSAPDTALEISEDNKIINGLVDYSSKGGGEITIRIKGLKKRIKTSKSVREIEINELTISGHGIDPTDYIKKVTDV